MKKRKSVRVSDDDEDDDEYIPTKDEGF